MNSTALILASIAAVTLLLVGFAIFFQSRKNQEKYHRVMREPVINRRPVHPAPVSPEMQINLAGESDVDAATQELEKSKALVQSAFSEFSDEKKELPTLHAPAFVPTDLCFCCYFYAPAGATITSEEMTPLADKLRARHIRIGKWLALRSCEGEWQYPDEQQHYPYWLLWLPFASRNGTINAARYRELVEEILAHAQNHRLYPTYPPQHDVARAAEALDDFCGTVDVIIDLHAISMNNRSVDANKLSQLAQAEGLRAESDNAYVCVDENDRLRFSMQLTDYRANDHAIRGLVFSCDLPNSTEPVGDFNRMVATANVFCKVFGLTLMDIQHEPINRSGLRNIEARIIDVIIPKMNDWEIKSGSERARILFSDSPLN